MIVRKVEGAEVVEGAHWEPEEMTAELYVILRSQGRVQPDGIVTFGTEGHGDGLVSYDLQPQHTGVVRMVRVA